MLILAFAATLTLSSNDVRLVDFRKVCVLHSNQTSALLAAESYDWEKINKHSDPKLASMVSSFDNLSKSTPRDQKAIYLRKNIGNVDVFIELIETRDPENSEITNFGCRMYEFAESNAFTINDVNQAIARSAPSSSIKTGDSSFNRWVLAQDNNMEASDVVFSFSTSGNENLRIRYGGKMVSIGRIVSRNNE